MNALLQSLFPTQATISTLWRAPFARWNIRHCGGEADAEAWQEEEPLVALYVTTPDVGDG